MTIGYYRQRFPDLSACPHAESIRGNVALLSFGLRQAETSEMFFSNVIKGDLSHEEIGSGRSSSFTLGNGGSG